MKGYIKITTTEQAEEAKKKGIRIIDLEIKQISGEWFRTTLDSWDNIIKFIKWYSPTYRYKDPKPSKNDRIKALELRVKELEELSESKPKTPLKKVDWLKDRSEGKFIGMEQTNGMFKGEKYLLVNKGSSKDSFVRADGTYSNKEQLESVIAETDSTFYVFETHKELYAWMAE